MRFPHERHLRCAVGLSLLAAACAPKPAGPEDAGAECADCAVVCPAGFAALDGGAGCGALLPATECAAGTQPTLGSTDCSPVGVRACPAGFATDESGWGCREVVSPTPCTGATREQLGLAACAAVSDCAAAFPPAGATLFVSAQFDAGQLDSTHFSTLAAAVAAADAGAVIAVDEGTYAGIVAPKVPLTLLGRCAQKVVLTAGASPSNGLQLVNLTGSVARNLTVRGFEGGIAVFGGSAELSGLVIEDNTISGLTVSNAGTQVTLRDSVIRGTRARPADRQAVGAYVQKQGTLLLEDVALSDNEFAAAVATSPDAGLTLRRSVARDSFPLAQGPAVGTFGVGAYVANGANLTVEDSALFHNTTQGVVAGLGGSRPGAATLRGSTVRDTRANPAVENRARGVEASKGATLVVEGCTVSGNREYELFVTEGSRARLSNTTTVGAAAASASAGPGLVVSADSEVEATSLAFVRPHVMGVAVEENARLRLTDSLVTDVVLTPYAGSTGGASGVGIGEKTGGSLVLVRAVVRRAVGVGVLVSNATAALEQTLVQDTLPQADLEGRAVSVQDQATFTATRSAFLGSHETGLAAFDPGTKATLTGCSVEGTHFDAFGRFGYGVIALTGASVEMSGCTVTGSQAIGVASGVGSMAIRGSFISQNPVGLHAQEGVTVVTADAVSLAPNVLAVSTDTRFVGNATRIGSGEVPLPAK